MVDEAIRFPVRLRCDLQEVNLTAGVSLRPMRADEVPQLLGVQSVVLDENGRLKSLVSSPDATSSLMGPDLDQYDQFYSSNYVAIVPSRDEAKNLNLALKLMGRSCTALWIGTSGDTSNKDSRGHSKHFLGPPCYFGSQPLRLDSGGPEALDAIASGCRRLANDRKFAVMADIFLYAMSVAPRQESRCIELSVVLEMLLLPKASTELSYRFALRLAKLASAKLGESSQVWFSKGQQIYRTRSRLVHSGQDDKLGEAAPLIEETARALLSMYVREPNLFAEAALDALCIAA